MKSKLIFLAALLCGAGVMAEDAAHKIKIVLNCKDLQQYTLDLSLSGNLSQLVSAPERL